MAYSFTCSVLLDLAADLGLSCSLHFGPDWRLSQHCLIGWANKSRLVRTSEDSMTTRTAHAGNNLRRKVSIAFASFPRRGGG
eukprot:5638260-Pleurochrysis_carterae.AAC.5